jgi:hypothetical protein
MRLHSFTISNTCENLNINLKDESYEKIIVIRGLSPHGSRKMLLNKIIFYIMCYIYLFNQNHSKNY